MKYPSISIQGNILSSDLLDQLAKGEFSLGQSPKDFGVQGPVKDEILFAWAEAQDHWRIFQRRIERLEEGPDRYRRNPQTLDAAPAQTPGL